MYYIGLDIPKKSISFCVKDATGQIYQQGKVAVTRRDLRRLDESDSPTLDGGDGSDDLYRLDLCLYKVLELIAATRAGLQTRIVRGAIHPLQVSTRQR